jgi:hypothetical protein
VDYPSKKYTPDPGDDPDEWVTDRFVANAHANREDEDYPTADRLLENLPVMLRGPCDYTLSGNANALDIARALASVIDVVVTVQREKSQRH